MINKEEYELLTRISTAIETLAIVKLLTKPDCFNLWSSALYNMRVSQADYNTFNLQELNK